jgi:hypothetical protein
VKARHTRTLAAILMSAVCVPALLSAASAGESKPFWLDVEAGAEYSDNVALEQSDLKASNGDVAATFEVDTGYKLVDEKDARVEIGYNAYQSIYQDLSAFNYLSQNPSLMAWIKPGGIKLGIEYSYTNSLLDNHFFLEQHMLSPTVSAFVSDDFYFTAYYRYFDKNYNRSDDGRDAKTHSFGGDLYYYYDRPNKGYFSFGAGYTNEDTQSDAFDYSGFMGRAAVQYPIELFDLKGHVKLSYNYQKRDYDNAISLAVLPNTDTRNDNRNTLKLSGDLSITDDLKALVEFRRVTRDSNLSTADYTENVGAASLKYSF